MAQRKAYLNPTKAACSLCGGNVQKLLSERGVLTAPVEVFDMVRDVAPTIHRAVCANCAGEVAAAHAALVEALSEARNSTPKQRSKGCDLRTPPAVLASL